MLRVDTGGGRVSEGLGVRLRVGVRGEVRWGMVLVLQLLLVSICMVRRRGVYRGRRVRGVGGGGRGRSRGTTAAAKVPIARATHIGAALETDTAATATATATLLLLLTAAGSRRELSLKTLGDGREGGRERNRKRRRVGAG